MGDSILLNGGVAVPAWRLAQLTIENGANFMAFAQSNNLRFPVRSRASSVRRSEDFAAK